MRPQSRVIGEVVALVALLSGIALSPEFFSQYSLLTKKCDLASVSYSHTFVGSSPTSPSTLSVFIPFLNYSHSALSQLVSYYYPPCWLSRWPHNTVVFFDSASVPLGSYPTTISWLALATPLLSWLLLHSHTPR